MPSASRNRFADAPFALVGGRLYTGLAEVTSDLTRLDGRGHWVVVLTFEGAATCVRFDDVVPAAPVAQVASGDGVLSAAGEWTSSLDRHDFGNGVVAIRSAIAAGDVYQVNLCRVLRAPAVAGQPHTWELGRRLAAGNPAPFAATVHLPEAGIHLASASPELFLRRQGAVVESRPIKGTASSRGGFLDKDRAENVMIVDLVRNDLGRVCAYGSVEVPALCAREEHPGLHHLVSTVRGRLRPDVGWAELLDATFPPGSVVGAPKLAALDIIRQLEPVPRGPYCGAIGWVDADRSEGELNVGIRTFWFDDGRWHLGTGGGITWDSTAAGEWEETELKARHLLRTVS